MPPRPAGLLPEDEHRFAKNEEGIMYVGDKGFILAGFNGNQARVYPESKKYQSPKPRKEEWDERHDEAVMQWIAACKGGPATNSTFESQAPVTEALLLGCIAQRVPWEKLQWDTAAKRVKNSEEATKLVDPPYRSGFTA
jgi:hypothetical protein